MTLSLFFALCLPLFATCNAVSSFEPARPPAIPLAVKSPYLSTWLNVGSDYGNGGYLAGQWPTHWTYQTTGWAGLIRVDDQVFQWMGRPANSVTGNVSIPDVDQISFAYTSTKSVFTMDVGGKVKMTITFLSPINADDLKRMSLPLSYMAISVVSIDGEEHNTQLYSDISGEFASGEHNATLEWDYGTSGNVAYHKNGRQAQIEFDENGKPDGNGMANWGSVYWAADNVDGLTSQSGADSVVRSAFAKAGKLDNSKDPNFRAIEDNWPVFAFAVDLGNVGTQPASQLFTIGLLQQNAIQFIQSQGVNPLPSLWRSYFSTDIDAVTFFHGDFGHQQEQSEMVDTKVESESVKVAGADYNVITSLSVRQAFGALQLVGTPEKTYLFMKEISSNGNTQTVDVIFPMHPILNYFNPGLLKLVLDPLYEYQESGQYPNSWSIHDLGAHYPNATGHPDGADESMPVEECGNMLIMTLAYAQRQNDVDYLKQHYPKLVQWTSFLVNDSLIPASQLSTDDFAGTLQNQTNLALKGIIGIRAMGEIARLTGNSDDEKKYNDISYDYIDKWQTLGIAYDANPPHTTLYYGANETHGLLYNLWSDIELGLYLVPQSVYDMQSSFYPTVKEKYGVPLDTRHAYTKSDWQMFSAACASPSTRDMFISDLALWVNETPTGKAFTDLYDTTNGEYAKNYTMFPPPTCANASNNSYPGFEFIARPVMGGTFALLVANVQMQGEGRCAGCRTSAPPDLRTLYAEAKNKKQNMTAVPFKA